MAISKEILNNKKKTDQPKPLDTIPETNPEHVSGPVDFHYPIPSKPILYNSFKEAVNVCEQIFLKPGESHTEFYQKDGVYHCVVAIGNIAQNTTHLYLTDTGNEMSIDDRLDNISAQVTNLSKLFSLLSKKFDNLNSSVEEFENNVSTALNEIRKDITNFENFVSQQINQVNVSINIFSEKIEDISNYVDGFDNRIQQNTDNILDLSTRIEEIENWKPTIDNSINQLENKVKLIDSSIIELKEKDVQIDSSIIELKEKDAQLDSSITKLIIKDIEIDSSILELKEKDVQLDLTIEELKEKDTQLDLSIEELKEKDVQIDSSIEELKEKDAQLDSSITKLIIKDIEIDSSILELKEKDNEINSSILELKEKDVQLDLTIEELKEKDAQLDSSIIELHNLINEFEPIDNSSIRSLFHDDIWTVNLCCYTTGGHVEIFDNVAGEKWGGDSSRVAECTPFNEYKTYVNGDDVSFMAVANEGYKFVRWYENGNEYADTSIISLVFNNSDIPVIGTLNTEIEPKILNFGYTALFKKLHKLNCKINQVVNNEDVSSLTYSNDVFKVIIEDVDKNHVEYTIDKDFKKNLYFDDDARIYVSAIPSQQGHHTFEGFIINGTEEIYEEEIEINHNNKDISILAKFEEWWIKVSADARSSEYGEIDYHYGYYLFNTSTSLKAIPNKGYVFTGWHGDNITDDELEKDIIVGNLHNPDISLRINNNIDRYEIHANFEIAQ